MWFPSARVRDVSEIATALNGAPVTTFPPCIPSKPSNSIRSPIGGPMNSPPGTPPWNITSAPGGGGGSCALTSPAPTIIATPRIKLIQDLRFIIPSPHLSRTVANSSPRQFPRFRFSIAAARSPNRATVFVHQRVPRPLLFPKTPSSRSSCGSPERGAPCPRNHYCGSLTAWGNPSFPTSKSTWIHSPARSSFTGRPSAPSAPRCIRTRTMAASSASAGKTPGSRVKLFNSLSATSVSNESDFAEPCCGPIASFSKFALLVFALPFCAAASAGFCGAPRCRAASSFWLFRQLPQLTAPISSAAAASAHAAITATRRVFVAPYCTRNSCRKRISTRPGASALAVASARACSSMRAACQESCSAAHRGHTLACSRAAARSLSLSEASRSASNPMASNSSHFISHFHFSSSSRHARAPRHVAQHLELRQQQRAPAVQPRSNRPHRTSGRLRRFFVAQLLQFAQHHRFAKLGRQLQHCGANLLHPLARFRPGSRSHQILQHNSRAASVLVLLFQRNFPRQSLQMLHHAVSRNSVQVSAKRSAARIVFLRGAHQSHENVLHNFFRGPCASGHAQREAVHRRLVPPVQKSESLFVALGGPPQQNVVSRWLSDPHLSWLDVLKPFKGYINRKSTRLNSSHMSISYA